MAHKYTSVLFGLLLTANQAGAQAFAALDINEIRARVHSTGLIGPDLANSTSAFVVPSANSAPLLYSSGLWLGGNSPDNQLKLAAHLYGVGPQQFWPGTLTNDGTATITQEVSTQYDQVWKVDQADVVLHRAYYDCMSDPGCDVAQEFPGGYTVPDVFINWPAMGHVDSGQDLYLAPFFDYDNDGNYDPYGGDHPCILGDQALFAIFNDVVPAATPIGVEVRMMPFAYTGDPALANTVFVLYKIINQGTQTLENFRVGHFADLELGCGNDDIVGTDVGRSLVYVANGDAVDESCLGTPGFGAQPPAFGMVVLKGPLLDADGIDNAMVLEEHYVNGTGFADGVIDNERFGLSNSMYFLREGPNAMTDPANSTQHFNYLRNIWKDGMPLTHGGTGYSTAPNAVATKFAFPGSTDPLGLGTGGVPQAPWSASLDGSGQSIDPRVVAGMGPFTLEPGVHLNLLVGYVYARAVDGGPEASVAALKQRVDSVRAFAMTIPGMWDGTEEGWPMDCISLPTGISSPNHRTAPLVLYPNPANENITFDLRGLGPSVAIHIHDMRGAVVLRTVVSNELASIGIAHLPQGPYMVQCITDAYFGTARFVKVQ